MTSISGFHRPPRRGLDLRDESVIRDVLAAAGVDADEVFRTVAEGGPRARSARRTRRRCTNHQVFGVPTFVVGDVAAFVRIMTRPGDDAAGARSTIDAVLALFDEHPELNEFKHTCISR